MIPESWTNSRISPKSRDFHVRNSREPGKAAKEEVGNGRARIHVGTFWDNLLGWRIPQPSTDIWVCACLIPQGVGLTKNREFNEI